MKYILHLRTIDIGFENRRANIKNGHVNSFAGFDDFEEMKEYVCDFLMDRLKRLLIEGNEYGIFPLSDYTLKVIEVYGIENILTDKVCHLQEYDAEKFAQEFRTCLNYYRKLPMDIVRFDVYEGRIHGNHKLVYLNIGECGWACLDVFNDGLTRNGRVFNKTIRQKLEKDYDLRWYEYRGKVAKMFEEIEDEHNFTPLGFCKKTIATYAIACTVSKVLTLSSRTFLDDTNPGIEMFETVSNYLNMIFALGVGILTR
jgi:hypothetical protein